jgi:2-oxoglutarate ferredoxin oxidoreductase subunit delta
MAKGRIEIEENRCKGCELCMSVCPKEIIRMADYFNVRGYRPAQLVDADHECTGCTLCALVCPDVVITVYRQVPVKSVTMAPA